LLTISADKLRVIVPMSDAISAVRAAFIALARGTADQPQRLSLDDGSLLAMAARVGDGGTAAKLLSIHPRNREVGLPTIQTLVIWFSPVTGIPTAIIEGEALTTIRTGAASGVATDLLARRDARILAIFGAGALAPDQIRAVLAVRPIEEVRILSLNHSHSVNLVESMRSEFADISFRACQTGKETAEGADVICTVTPASSPLFADSDVAAGCHINALGAFRPTMCEVGPNVLARAQIVCVDHIPAALEEAGDVIQAINGGWIDRGKLASIGTLLQSDVRRDDAWVTVFKSVGVAVQDWAITALAVDKALAAKVSP
jgi:ornithine cyclodeaminase/alanine dehydrogenase-like protein (mu-crystallin family)